MEFGGKLQFEVGMQIAEDRVKGLDGVCRRTALSGHYVMHLSLTDPQASGPSLLLFLGIHVFNFQSGRLIIREGPL